LDKKNSSGLALVVQNDNKWKLVAVAPSYKEFLAQTCGGTEPTNVCSEILSSIDSRWAIRPQIIAVDMPLATVPILGRRESDNAVSRAYGGRKCSTHSPNRERPGQVGELLLKSFELEGYPLRTLPFSGNGLIEVYPHPALLNLANANERLPYKWEKRSRYWKDASSIERHEKIVAVWKDISMLLDQQIEGVEAAIESYLDIGKMKATEDVIDAIVCAWVGICVLENKATPLGDHESAIWIPDVMR